MGRTSDARERLVSSGIRLIHARSYRDVTVDDVCADAGVNKGSFYYYFPSKQALAVAVVEAQWARTRANLLEPAFAHDVSPRERILRFFHMASAIHQARFDCGGQVLGCAFGNLALELSTQDPVVLSALRSVFDGYCRYFAATIADAAAEGDLCIRDVDEGAHALLAFFEGALLLAKTNNDARIIAHLAPSALALLDTRPGTLAGNRAGQCQRAAEHT